MEKKVILLYNDFNEKLISGLCRKTTLKTIGLHFNPYVSTTDDFLKFIDKNRDYIDSLEKQNIQIEYFMHCISYLLPRELINQEKEYFRLNDGVRTADFNCCPSSKGALKIIEENSFNLAKFLKQKSHLYHLWLDDDLGNDVSCKCELCKNNSFSEQNLLIYEAVLKGLKKYDKEAKLGFLIYGTEELPNKLNNDMFIEYAPFKRNHIETIDSASNVFFQNRLKSLMKFKNVSVIEYFLSFDFKNYLKNNDRVVNDLIWYKKNGIKNITTFVVFNDNFTNVEKIKGIVSYLL